MAHRARERAEPPAFLAPGVPILNQWTGMARLADLQPHPDNPHTSDDAALAESLATNGWYGFIVAQAGTKYILAGHGRQRVAQRSGASEVPVLWIDCDEATARRVLLADNKITQRGTDDPLRLAEALESLRGLAGGLAGTGYSAEDLAELHERIAERALSAGERWTEPGQEDDDGEGIDPDDRDPLDDEDEDGPGASGAPDGSGQHAGDGAAGTLLAKLDLELVTPRHVVQKGEVWRVGHHVLCISDVFRAWPVWQPWLARQVEAAMGDEPEPRSVVFAPFPGPFLPLSRRAQAMRFVLVQPNLLVCGHLLDRWADIYGEAGIERVQTTDG